MKNILPEQSISSTDPIYAPFPPPTGSSWVVWVRATQAGTIAIECDADDGMGWLPYSSSNAHTANTTSALVAVGGIRSRVSFTPDAGSGSISMWLSSSED